MKIAVSGKGGVGKTTVAAFLVKALGDRGRRVLAIDADPSPHLAMALDFPRAEEICPIAEMQGLIQERSERDGPFYRLNPRVNDLPERFIREKGNIKLMVLGAIQQGGAGCACAENAVLRTLLNTLLLSRDEDMVIDMEAGVEHLGRGTVASVDCLLVVIQPYRGSLETANKILALGRDLKMKHLKIVANQVHGREDLDYIQENLGVKPIGVFFTSEGIREAERSGLPIYEADHTFGKSAGDLLTVLEQME